LKKTTPRHVIKTNDPRSFKKHGYAHCTQRNHIQENNAQTKIE